MSRAFVLLTILGALLANCSQAFAWGHLVDLNDSDYGPSFLAPVIAKRGQFSYCLDIDKSVQTKFSEASLALQVEAVFRQWLRPVEKAGFVGNVKIAHVGCEAKSYDVRIRFGPELKYPSFGAYEVSTSENGRWVSLVKINTDHLSSIRTGIVDFEELMKIKDSRSLADQLQRLALVPGYPIHDFATDNKVGYIPLFWSSYRILLHELGHTFGLCDTEASRVKQSCDPGYLTPVYQGSVMSDSNFMSLTNDDRDGIVQLFKRFKK